MLAIRILLVIFIIVAYLNDCRKNNSLEVDIGLLIMLCALAFCLPSITLIIMSISEIHAIVTKS